MFDEDAYAVALSRLVDAVGQRREEIRKIGLAGPMAVNGVLEAAEAVADLVIVKWGDDARKPVEGRPCK